LVQELAMAVDRRFFLLGAAGFGLSACGSSFEREAGIGLDEGAFGNPTMHNHLVQTGQISLAEIMTRRFHDEVPSMVNFDFGSAALSSDAKSILLKQADWMKRFPELRFTVYGHTDAVGSTASNYRLGLRRAQAVRNYLVARGVPHRSIIAIVSRGEEQPLIVSEGREPANRRTVTEISGAIRRHPNVMNGEYARIIHREYVASGAQVSTR